MKDKTGRYYEKSSNKDLASIVIIGMIPLLNIAFLLYIYIDIIIEEKEIRLRKLIRQEVRKR